MHVYFFVSLFRLGTSSRRCVLKVKALQLSQGGGSADTLVTGLILIAREVKPLGPGGWGSPALSCLAVTFFIFVSIRLIN